MITVRDIEYQHLGSYLREKRQIAELTQDQVASALGYSERQFISRIENGRVSLPIEKIPLLADLLKISVHELAEAVIEEQVRIVQERIDKIIHASNNLSEKSI